MKKLALGAMLVLGLAFAAGPGPSYAAGDGLTRYGRAQGNGRTGGMHRGAVRGSRGVMMRRHHRMMRRRHR